VLWGRTHIGLRCVEGEKPWQVWLPIQVKVMAPALVALQALPIGTVLQASHLEKIEIDWAADRRAPFPSRRPDRTDADAPCSRARRRARVNCASANGLRPATHGAGAGARRRIRIGRRQR
jgi:hypothetical protein